MSITEQKTCTASDCDLSTRSLGVAYCEKHYMRTRRYGTLEGKPHTFPATKKHSQGYVLLYAPNHPLVAPNGHYVYQHRVVLFDSIGAGDHPCHWCGEVLSWTDIEVDHVNGTKDDNTLSNLVPSCHSCNTRRGTSTMRSKVRSNVGITFNGETLTKGEWADRLDINVSSIGYRLNHGWSIEAALTTPRGKTGPARTSTASEQSLKRMDRE